MSGSFKRQESPDDIDERIAQVLDDAQAMESDICFWRTVTSAVVAQHREYLNHVNESVIQKANVDPSTLTREIIAEVEQTKDKLEQHTNMFDRFAEEGDMGLLTDRFQDQVIDHLRRSGNEDVALLCENDFPSACDRYHRGFQKGTAVLRENGLNV